MLYTTRFHFWLSAFFVLLLTACSSSSSHQEEPPISEDELADCTVMVYMVADNNLSSYAEKDLEEMKVGMSNVKNSNVHLLVYIDTIVFSHKDFYIVKYFMF